MISVADRRILIDVARQSIRHGLDTGRPLAVDCNAYPETLGHPAATFVTLETGGELRGCIGRLEAQRPLVEDIAENAFAAAFRDSRFPPLTAAEWPALDIHISVLTPAEPLPVAGESELLATLRPGRDGLILEDGRRRATFLPSVWESLPDKEEFLAHLKLKAGMATDYWSPSLRFYRYETENFAG